MQHVTVHKMAPTKCRLLSCLLYLPTTICPESSDPPKKMFNIFASENEVYTIY